MSEIVTKESEQKKWQIRENNDRLIRRLVDARVFKNKDMVIAAALQTLMAGLVEMQARQKRIVEEAAAAAEALKVNSSEVPNSSTQESSKDALPMSTHGQQPEEGNVNVDSTTGPSSAGDSQAS